VDINTRHFCAALFSPYDIWGTYSTDLLEALWGWQQRYGPPDYEITFGMMGPDLVWWDQPMPEEGWITVTIRTRAGMPTAKAIREHLDVVYLAQFHGICYTGPRDPWTGLFVGPKTMVELGYARDKEIYTFGPGEAGTGLAQIPRQWVTWFWHSAMDRHRYNVTNLLVEDKAESAAIIHEMIQHRIVELFQGNNQVAFRALCEYANPGTVWVDEPVWAED
jgi:hypothetical protein